MCSLSVLPEILPSTSLEQRGSQAGRLADELRRIASGQAAASLAMSDAGARLVADARAEQPPPREYSLHSGASRRRRLYGGGKLSESSGGLRRERRGERPECKDRGKESRCNTAVTGPSVAKEAGGGREAGGGPGAAGSFPGAGAAAITAMTEGGGHLGGRQAGVSSAVTAVARNAASPSVEAAAGREETAAAARIQLFLRRRRLHAEPGEARASTTAPVEAPPSEHSDDSGSGDSYGATDWFAEALRFLQQEIDKFLLGDEAQGSASGDIDTVSSRLSGASDPARALDPENDDTHAAASLPEADNDRSADHETAAVESPSSSSSDDDDDDGDLWPEFPPLPLRARAPSLYTLSPPGRSAGARTARGGGDGDEGATAPSGGRSAPTAGGDGGGIFTKLDPDVAARLSSARSVFCLRAADVLTAFSPPPLPDPSPLSAAVEPTSRSRGRSSAPSLSPVSASVGGRGDGGGPPGGSRRLSAPDALRRRLRTEAEDASRAGLGRPWLLSSRRTRTPTRHRREQDQLSAFVRAKNKADRGGGGGGGGVGGVPSSGIDQQERSGEKRLRPVEFFGPCTPLGRRLAKRFRAGRAARRRRILGEADAFRVRHVGRQLRSGAAADALDRAERALDGRLSTAREKRVPPAHVTGLLDILDRFVLSDSQVP